MSSEVEAYKGSIQTIATLTDALEAVRKLNRFQNEAAAMKLMAERRAGELLDTDAETASTIPDREQSRYRKLANIERSLFDDYLANAYSTGDEITRHDILKLTPVNERTPRSGIAQSYTAPPIDVQIAREFGLKASDERVELITRAIQSALDSMPNPRHAFVWARYHGIEDDGMMGDRWTYAAIAVQMGCSREYVESLYYRASHHVLSRVSAAALNAWTTAMHAR